MARFLFAMILWIIVVNVLLEVTVGSKGRADASETLLRGETADAPRAPDPLACETHGILNCEACVRAGVSPLLRGKDRK